MNERRDGDGAGDFPLIGLLKQTDEERRRKKDGKSELKSGRLSTDTLSALIWISGAHLESSFRFERNRQRLGGELQPGQTSGSSSSPGESKRQKIHHSAEWTHVVAMWWW